MAKALEGRPVSRALLVTTRDDLADIVTRIGRTPALAAVLTGNDESAVAYLRAIQRSFRRAGLTVQVTQLPESVSEDRFRDTLGRLNDDPLINGIIVLQPLPRHLPARIASELVAPGKDVDGITPESAGYLAIGAARLLPSTPAGGMEILRYYDIPIAGRHAVVVGRSSVVGKPMALLLLDADATVTVCHSRTPDLAAFTRQADILVAAAGRAGLITAQMVCPGATVLDFGVNFREGQIIGDVDPNAAEVAGAITPVPGGTGVVTNAILIRNTLRAARAQLGLGAWSEMPASVGDQ